MGLVLFYLTAPVGAERESDYMKNYTRKEMKQLDQSVKLRIRDLRERIQEGGSESFIDALRFARDASIKQHKDLCAAMRKVR